MNVNRIDNKVLWQEYLDGKQTYAQLSQKYDVSTRTIQRHLDKFTVSKQFIKPKDGVILLIDTTYFGRGFGVMTFLSDSGKTLYWKYVKYETIAEYVEGVKYLEAQGVSIKAIVCDGRKGLLKALSNYPLQMCQFHQIAIVTRYITRKPRLQASIELKEIVHLLHKTDKESFFGMLDEWYIKWKGFINERVVSPETGKSRYIHKRLRSAYKSCERNKNYLFTWYDHIEMGIPNTNNILEGRFTDLKNKLRNHNGLIRKRKEKFIDGFFKASAKGMDIIKADLSQP